MTGEKMTKIYIAVGLGIDIKLNTKEEEEFYNRLQKEMREKGKVEWAIPSE